MKKVQICVRNNPTSKTIYYDVIIDNKQTVADAIAIVKKNSTALGISPLAYINRGLSGVQCADQHSKCKPGTILDGDWNSYCFGDILVKGGK